DLVSINCCRKECGDYGAVRIAAVFTSEPPVHANGHPAVTPQKQVTMGNLASVRRHQISRTSRQWSSAHGRLHHPGRRTKREQSAAEPVRPTAEIKRHCLRAAAR